MKWHPSTLCIGSPGGGKSFAAAVDALSFPGTAVIADPAHDSIADIVLEHAEGNVLYDRLSDIKNRLGYELLRPSRHPDPDERAKQNHTRARLFVEIMMRRRGADIRSTPLLEEWVSALLLLFLFQVRPKPLRILPYGFLPDSDEFNALVRDCPLPDLRAKFEDLAEQKRGTRRSEVGSAARLVNAIFRSPSFLARCDGGFDLGAFLQLPNAKLIIERGDEIDADAVTTIIGAVVLLVIEHAKTRKAPWPPIRVWLDECTNAKTAGKTEEQAIFENRKDGLSFCLMLQYPDFPNGAEGFFQGCKVKQIFQTADYDLARKLAGIIAAENPSGMLSRAEQVAGLTTQIMRLEPGWRFVTGPGGSAEPQYVPMIEPAWPDWPGEGDEPGYREAMRQEKLCEIYARPEYRATAASSSPSGSEPETPSSSSSPDDSSPAGRLKKLRGGLPPDGGAERT